MKPLRRRGSTPVAARARHRQPQGRAGPRGEGRLDRDDLRDRYFGFRDAGTPALAAERTRRRAPQGGRAVRLDHHAEAENKGLPSAHTGALGLFSHAARNPHLRLSPRSAGEGDRRHGVPAARRRRQRAAAGSAADDADLVDGRAAHAERAMDELRREVRRCRNREGLGVRRRAQGPSEVTAFILRSQRSMASRRMAMVRDDRCAASSP